jgi:putative ABC transport system permease protein
MWKVTRRGLWSRKLRFASTALAIVLGVGFLAGVRILTDTLGRTFEDLFASVYEGTDAVVQRTERVERGLGAPDARLPADVLERVREVQGVEVAEGYTQAYAQLVKRNGRPLGGRSDRRRTSSERAG